MAVIDDVNTNDLKHLENLAIMVTNKCNLNCYHCFRSEELGKESIDFNKLQSLAKILKQTSISKVRLTGGEPFLVKGIEDFIAIFSKEGYHTSIVTNGTLTTNKRLELLKKNGLNELWFSVHSAISHNHDSLVGEIGSLNKLTKAINFSIQIGLTTNIYYPISKQNYHDTEITLNWLDKIGVNRVKILRITPSGRASQSNNFTHFTSIEWDRIIESICSLNLKNISIKVQGYSENKYGKCTILPFKHINIDPNGDIFPCCLLSSKLDYKIGNCSQFERKELNSVLFEMSNKARELYLQKGPFPCSEKNSIKGCPLFSKDFVIK
jgi:radical SAM protein with 4Fe4S-binding SPASM domain